MDIILEGSNEGMLMKPSTVHGMLWLQTHFEDKHWGAIASGEVKLPIEDSFILANDALNAGLKINSLPVGSKARKF